MTKEYPLDVTLLNSDDCTTLMSKGHHEPVAFIKECEAWNGGPLEGWSGIKYEWGRTIPCRDGEYAFLMIPAVPHSRGAYPTTTVEKS